MKPTTDEVLAWAREAGGWQQWEARVMTPQVLERFAALAYAAGAAAMKERAARVCVDIALKPSNVILGVATDCAAAIRALGDDDDE